MSDGENKIIEKDENKKKQITTPSNNQEDIEAEIFPGKSLIDGNVSYLKELIETSLIILKGSDLKGMLNII
jgi:hypothetical protein